MRERGTLISSLVLLGSLAAGSYWLAVRARLSDPVPHRPGHEVDYFAEHFNLTRMDDAGNALYTLSSERMTHFADDDSTALVKPQLTSVRRDQPVVHMASDSGNVTSDGEQVMLTGHVTLTRAASADDPELKGFGSKLLVLPEQDIAKSDEPFQIVHGGSTVWARTMLFDNTNRLVRMNDGVKSRGHTVIEPQQHPAPRGPQTKPAT